mmetsp:Transcript_24486/g.79928  ORF Transcript_24486/g.79928 Transcript_24486/m.79928 type:complete len:262 (+) Transcript_24486:121-906(+)
MCRWLLYYGGKEVCAAGLIFGASHSLAQQSESAGFTPGIPRNEQRNHAVNVHGCGVGWYASSAGQGMMDKFGLDHYSRPAVYTTIAPPTHDRNLRRLSKCVETSLLFGHVRAAGPGASVHEYNCHPFCCGRYMFMHNGEVGGFKKVRRRLLSKLSDELFSWVSGTTDSEVVVCVVLERASGHRNTAGTCGDKKRHAQSPCDGVGVQRVFAVVAEYRAYGWGGCCGDTVSQLDDWRGAAKFVSSSGAAAGRKGVGSRQCGWF